MDAMMHTTVRWAQIKAQLLTTPEAQAPFAARRRYYIAVRQLALRLHAVRQRLGLSKADLARRSSARRDKGRGQ